MGFGLRLLFSLLVLPCLVQAADFATSEIPFLCSSLIHLQSRPSLRVAQMREFVSVPRILKFSDEVSAAEDWLAELEAGSQRGSVSVVRGTIPEMARFFYELAVRTDEQAADIEYARRRKGAFRPELCTRPTVRPLASPARHLQIEIQCLGGDATALKPIFMTIHATQRDIWGLPAGLLPDGKQTPREMGMLLTHDTTPGYIRAAFLFLDP